MSGNKSVSVGFSVNNIQEILKQAGRLGVDFDIQKLKLKDKLLIFACNENDLFSHLKDRSTSMEVPEMFYKIHNFFNKNSGKFAYISNAFYTTLAMYDYLHAINRHQIGDGNPKEIEDSKRKKIEGSINHYYSFFTRDKEENDDIKFGDDFSSFYEKLCEYVGINKNTTINGNEAIPYSNCPLTLEEAVILLRNIFMEAHKYKKMNEAGKEFYET